MDVSGQQEHKSKQALKMKRDWNLRAAQDAIAFTSPYMERRELPELFQHGRQQAHMLTHDSFKELAFDPTGKRMLDIGCGIGRLFSGFTEMFTEIWGVDVSEELIQQATRLHTSPSVRFIENSGYDLTGIPDDHRVLRPGGVFQLHFRTNKRRIRNYVYWRLPGLMKRPSQILFRLLLLYPLRRLPVATPHIPDPGHRASWIGSGFTTAEVEGHLIQLGFVGVRTLADQMYLEGMKFWVIGRKPPVCVTG